MQQQGYIRLLYSFKDWRYYSDPSTCRLFVHLLLNVNYTQSEYMGATIEKGQLVTTQAKLCAETGLSRQQVRTALHKLSVAHEIIVSSKKVQTKFGQSSDKVRTKFGQSSTLITILHLESYVQVQPTNNQRITNEQPTNNQRITNEQRTNNTPLTQPEKKKSEEVDSSSDNTPIKKSVAKKKSPDEYSLVTKCRAKFEEFFSKRYQELYYWTGEDARATKLLLNKLKRSRDSHTPPKPTDDDSMVVAFEQFIKMISNDWLFDNFDMKTINGQYNKIIARYKNPYRYTGDNYTALRPPQFDEHSSVTSETFFQAPDIDNDPNWEPGIKQ